MFKCSHRTENMNRNEFKQSLGMNFVSPFQPDKEFEVYNSWKCSQIIHHASHQSITISLFYKVVK